MKIRYIFLSLAAGLAAFAMTSCGGSASSDGKYANHAEAIAAEFVNPNSTKVLVASHRGDWRNWPENSLQAMESVIAMGVDVMELDLKLTADSVLVICHDRTLNRTTTGTGWVKDVTYDYIQQQTLKSGHGGPTEFKMPTLREALEVCKDRIMVNVDQGYEFYDMVLEITEELGVTDQILIKGKKPTAVVAEDFGKSDHNMLYMPIIDVGTNHGQRLFQDYQDNGVVPVAYEVCFTEINPELEEVLQTIKDTGSKIWINTLWPSVCAGYTDDKAAIGDPDEIYGKIIDLGAKFIQTDRPEYLLKYLRSKGLHD